MSRQRRLRERAPIRLPEPPLLVLAHKASLNEAAHFAGDPVNRSFNS
jgi:hypothetical protein